MGPCPGCEQQKETVSSVPACFRADLGTKLSRGGCNRSIVWLGSSVVECSHGKLKTLSSSPGRATFFFRSCGIGWLSVDQCSGCVCFDGSGMFQGRI